MTVNACVRVAFIRALCGTGSLCALRIDLRARLVPLSAASLARRRALRALPSACSLTRSLRSTCEHGSSRCRPPRSLADAPSGLAVGLLAHSQPPLDLRARLVPLSAASLARRRALRALPSACSLTRSLRSTCEHGSSRCRPPRSLADAPFGPCRRPARSLAASASTVCEQRLVPLSAASLARRRALRALPSACSLTRSLRFDLRARLVPLSAASLARRRALRALPSACSLTRSLRIRPASTARPAVGRLARSQTRPSGLAVGLLAHSQPPHRPASTATSRCRPPRSLADAPFGPCRRPARSLVLVLARAGGPRPPA